VAAIKFLYEVTLDRPEVAQKIPWPGVVKKQPDILSGTEVEHLLQAIETLLCRTVVIAAYSTGMRIGEACKLQIDDIDSKRGLIHIRDGKRRKDRFVMLSPRLLKILRQY
jgi:integrase